MVAGGWRVIGVILAFCPAPAAGQPDSPSPDVLAGHNVCADHHNPARCHRDPCVVRRERGEDGKRRRPPNQPIFKGRCVEALVALGGRAKSGDIARETGFTSTQISGSLRAAKGIRYEHDKTSSRGFWVLEIPQAAN